MVNNDQEKNLNDPQTWKESGNEFFNKGQYEDAAKCYSHAIELNPDFIDAWNNLGLSLLKLGKIDEAKKCNEKVKILKKGQGLHEIKKIPHDLQINTKDQSTIKKSENAEEIRKKYEDGVLSYNQYQDLIREETSKSETLIKTANNKTEKETLEKEYCRNCGEELPYRQGEWPVSVPKICPSCGIRVKDPIRYGSREGQGRTHKEGLKNPRIAALLSIIPGLGQVYNGQLGKGVLFLIVTILGFILIIPGVIVWIYGIYDAFKTAKQMNYGDIPFQELKTKNILVFFSLLIIGGLVIVGISTMNTKPTLFTKSSEQTFSLGLLPKKTLDDKYILENGNEKITVDVLTYLYDKCNSSYRYHSGLWCDNHPNENYLYIDVVVENVGDEGIKSRSLKFSLIDYAGYEMNEAVLIDGMYPGDKRHSTLIFDLGTDKDQKYQKMLSQDFKLKCIYGQNFLEWTIPKCESCLIPTPTS